MSGAVAEDLASLVIALSDGMSVGSQIYPDWQPDEYVELDLQHHRRRGDDARLIVVIGDPRADSNCRHLLWEVPSTRTLLWHLTCERGARRMGHAVKTTTRGSMLRRSAPPWSVDPMATQDVRRVGCGRIVR